MLFSDAAKLSSIFVGLLSCGSEERPAKAASSSSDSGVEDEAGSRSGERGAERSLEREHAAAIEELARGSCAYAARCTRAGLTSCCLADEKKRWLHAFEGYTEAIRAGHARFDRGQAAL